MDTLSSKRFILTCDHVLQINDSSGKVIKYADSLFGTFNLTNDSSVTVSLKYAYQDSISDFALLEYSSLPLGLSGKIESLHFPFYFLEHTDDLKEGETVFYSGFPMTLGVGIKSYPVSRVGMISQMVKKYSYIIIDGFVQGGYSGSPVLSIRYINKGWRLGFIGIIRAYPNDYAKIISSKDKKSENRLAVVNSGFTYVIKIDKVIDVLRTKYGFK